MNIAPLYDLRDRLNAGAVAGVKLLPEDFRLKRAVEGMQSLAGASPVFGRIYEMARKLVSPECENRALQLLDVLALADAVLITQGETGAPGEIEPLPLPAAVSYADRPYSTLAPVMQALTEGGSGRFSFLYEQLDNRPEVFGDYRLRQTVVAVLGDSYSEGAGRFADYIAATGDRSWIPLLKKGFDPQGKKEMVRRLSVIGALGKEAENGFYLSLLEESSKEVRAAAIEALRHDQGNAELLLNLVKTGKGACKTAAQQALGGMESPEVEAYWAKLIASKPESALPFLQFSFSDRISELVAEVLLTTLKVCVEEKKALSKDAAERLCALIGLMNGKSSPAMCEVYRFAAARFDELNALELEDGKRFHVPEEGGNGQHLCGRAFPPKLTESLMLHTTPVLTALAKELFDRYGDDWAVPALTAAFQTESGEAVFKTFSPYYKKSLLPFKKAQKAEVGKELDRVFGVIHFQEQERCWQMRHLVGLHYLRVSYSTPLADRLDSRWLSVLTCDRKEEKLREGLMGAGSRLIFELTDPACPEQAEFARDYILKQARLNPCSEYFGFLVRCGQRDFRGLVVLYAKKTTYLYDIDSFVESLPMTDREKGEELLEIAHILRTDKKRYGNPDQLEEKAKFLLAGGTLKTEQQS